MDLMGIDSTTAAISPAQPQDHYVDRLPSPPRIQILPPKDGIPPRLPSRLIGPDNLFSNVNLSPSAFPLLEWGIWSYYQRHTAQPILPFLYLGSTAAVRNHDFLRTTGVTLIIYARHNQPEKPASTVRPAFLTSASTALPHITSHVLEISSNAELARSITSTNTLITHHLTTNNVRTNGASIGRVLLCCETGNERSAALAIAYLMEISDLSLEEACQLVQNQRFALNVDDGLRWMLKAWEDVLRARREIDGANDASMPDPPPVVRRQSILCNIPAAVQSVPDRNGLDGSISAERRGSTKRNHDDYDDDSGAVQGPDGDHQMGDVDPAASTANGLTDVTSRTNVNGEGRHFMPFKATNWT